VLGIRQWNLYTTSTVNDGHFTQDLTPSNTSAGGETVGANYCVFTNLSGGSFDLMITNGNYGGVNAIEIVANPAPPTVIGIRADGSNVVLTWPQGVLLEATNLMGPWTTNNAVSPYTNQPGNPQMYYRVIVQ
jgi:hypothetical protein